MKRSIKHLPKRTQEELNKLLELITRHVPWCNMVVLFGSYARGGYVLWDEKVEFGINTSYQSDYDIMVVVSKSGVKHVEDRLRSKVTPKYHAAFAHRRHASPQFIVEYADTLNKELERSQYFFTEIIKDGIKIYDTKAFKLAKPRELSFKEIKEIAIKEFDIHFQYGEDFIDAAAYLHHLKDRQVTASFQLHQSCERFYNAISLVFTNYRPKSHKLNELGACVKEYSRELATVFPLNTDFEKRCFNLLCRAYIEARYNKDFTVTKEELAYMFERTEMLKEIVQRICAEKIASYNNLIEQ
jgi:predicted nucleotidyltransferase